MRKKKSKALVLTALFLALVSLILSSLALLATSAQPADHSHLVDDLYAQNQQLKTDLAAMNQRLDELMTVVNLKTWSLDVTAWPDSTGADVTLTAQPSQYQTGVSATFLVLLENRQVASIPCAWDGTAFTATANLDSADGYRYYCQLASAGGTQQLPLTGPDYVDAGIPVYLKSALSAYCNLVVNDWIQQDGKLLLTDAYAQAQLPQINAAGAVKIESAELVLKLGGNDSARVPIQLSPSEVAGSFELTIENVQLPMIQLKGAESLELYLQITLSDGRRLQAFGVSWHMEGNELTSAVG